MNIQDLMMAHVIDNVPTEILVDQVLKCLNKWKAEAKDEHICAAMQPMMMLVGKHEIANHGVKGFAEKTDMMRKARNLIVDHKKPERSN